MSKRCVDRFTAAALAESSSEIRTAEQVQAYCSNSQRGQEEQASSQKISSSVQTSTLG